MVYNREDIEKLLLVDKLSYKKIGSIYGVSGVWIRKKCIDLGIEIPVSEHRKNNSYIPHNKGISKVKEIKCKNCLAIIERDGGSTPKFCNIKCHGEYKKKNNEKNWLDNQDLFTNTLKVNMITIKRIVMREQNNKCSICGIDDIWNGEKMVLILDHIDGNAANNTRKNLRCVCHNCDSQLPTYKSKNKISARTKRYN